jgi:acetylornithine/N-succinyldiaminopimelate aminotransferase
MAKALGNGIPIGAMLCREDVGLSLSAGTHGSTFGGNLLAAEAAKATLRLIDEPKMLAGVAEKGEYFLSQARALMQKHPEKIAAVRGRGLLCGIEVKGDAAAVVAKCREGGMLVNLAGDKTVRFAPPFIVTREELDEGLKIFERAAC